MSTPPPTLSLPPWGLLVVWSRSSPPPLSLWTACCVLSDINGNGRPARALLSDPAAIRDHGVGVYERRAARVLRQEGPEDFASEGVPAAGLFHDDRKWAPSYPPVPFPIFFKRFRVPPPPPPSPYPLLPPLTSRTKIDVLLFP